MNATYRIIEKFWLVFTIAAVIYAFYAIFFTEGWPGGAKNFIVPAISFCWWYFRRMMRIRLERTAKNQQQT
jgi:Flp pilus assembly protein TadB